MPTEAPLPCDLCLMPTVRRVWIVAPNLMVCRPCANLPWRQFHEDLIDRFGKDTARLYPLIAAE